MHCFVARKHEWEKHGTCATNLTKMNTEHKFFSIILALNSQYDLYRYSSNPLILWDQVYVHNQSWGEGEGAIWVSAKSE